VIARYVVKYDILSGTTAGELAVEVGRKIDFGWQPFGAPYVSDGIHYQAIVVYQ